MAMHERLDNNDTPGAVAVAKLAAPYVHPRPRPSDREADIGMMRDDELDELCNAGASGAGAAAEDTE